MDTLSLPFITFQVGQLEFTLCLVSSG